MCLPELCRPLVGETQHCQIKKEKGRSCQSGKAAQSKTNNFVVTPSSLDLTRRRLLWFYFSSALINLSLALIHAGMQSRTPLNAAVSMELLINREVFKEPSKSFSPPPFLPRFCVSLQLASAGGPPAFPGLPSLWLQRLKWNLWLIGAQSRLELEEPAGGGRRFPGSTRSKSRKAE